LQGLVRAPPFLGSERKATHGPGETNEFGTRVVMDRVHSRDLHTTRWHSPVIDHTELEPLQGRDFRLTDVEGELATKLMA